MAQKRAWIDNPQKDIKYVFISFIQAYLFVLLKGTNL